MIDIRGEVDQARQALMDAEATAQRLRYQPGACALLTDPTAIVAISPVAAMFTACRQLVGAAHRVLGLDPSDSAGWETAVGEITQGLAGVIALQSLWQRAGDDANG